MWNLPNREIKRKERLITKIMCDNFVEKLSGEIISRNYELVYYIAQNVGIIGILSYPKIHQYPYSGE